MESRLFAVFIAAIFFYNTPAGSQTTSTKGEAERSAQNQPNQVKSAPTIPPLQFAFTERESGLKRLKKKDYLVTAVFNVSNNDKAALSYRVTISVPQGPEVLFVKRISVKGEKLSERSRIAPKKDEHEWILTPKEKEIDAGQSHRYETQVTLECDVVESCLTVDKDKQSVHLLFKLNGTEYRTIVSSPENIAKKPEPNEIVRDDDVTKSGLFLERALVKKTLADELFLRGTAQSVAKASKKYDEAHQATRDVLKEPQIEAQRLATARFLLADIDYRKTLISGGLDFWGGYRSRTPAIPIRHLAAMEDLLFDFEKVLTQIDGLSETTSNVDQDLIKAKASLYDLNGKLGAYVVDTEKAVVSQKRERRSINDTWANIAEIESQHVRLAERMAVLASQQKSLNDRASGLLVRAVASSAGVDPSLIDSIKSGDVNAVVTSYIAQELGDPSSEFTQNLSQISAESQKFVEMYSKIREKAVVYEDLRSDVETVAEAIRRPTADSVAALGQTIWNRLPAEKRQKLANDVSRKASSVEWMRSAHRVLREAGQPEEFLRREAAKLLEEAGMSVDDLRAVIHSGVQRIQALEAQTVQRLEDAANSCTRELLKLNLTTTQAKGFLDAYSKGFSAHLVDELPNEARALLRAHFDVADDTRLAETLRQVGIRDLNVLKDGADQIVLQSAKTGQSVKVSQQALGQQIRLGRDVERAAGDVEQYLDLLAKQDRAMASIALSTLPFETLVSQIDREKSISRGKNVADALQRGIPATQYKAVVEKLAATTVGQAYAEEAIAGGSQTANPSPLPQTQDDGIGVPQGGGLDPAANQAMTLALDAAFPGAGTAFQMAQTFGAMEANRGLNERLSQESMRLMARKVELIDRQTENYFDEVLAQMEQTRAEALAESIRQQLALYQQSLRNSIEERSIAEAKIGLRRGWTFYLAERLREEFDAFDRSFALWARGAAASGVVEQEIRADPQNVRYALDSEIQLFDWLSRTRESSRSDPDTLRVHWARMVRLAKDLCQKRGCKPGDGMLGQIGSTRPLSLVEELLAPDDRARLRKWQVNPQGRFQAEVTLLPWQRLVPNDLQNVRLIEIRLSTTSENGIHTAAEQITLRHQGLSYVARAQQLRSGASLQQYELESMLPRSSHSFNSAQDFDLESLRTRYDPYFTGSNLPSARVFEGYGLFANYVISIEPTRKNIEAKDFVLRIAYHYNDPTMVLSEAQFMQALLQKSNHTMSGIIQPVKIELQETRGQCKQLPASSSMRSAGDPNLVAKWFFLRSADPLRRALTQQQVAALRELDECNSIELAKVCKSSSELRAAIDSYARQPEFLKHAKESGLVPDSASYDEAKLALIQQTKATAQELGCTFN